MFEILIRIESLCQESSSIALLGCGLGLLVVGVLLWLGGSYFSTVILGLLGAVVGSASGLLVCQWVGSPALMSMLIGAFVLTAAAVIFRNVLIIILATLVFGLAGMTAYSGHVLKETPPKTFATAETADGLTSDLPLDPGLIKPFSQMDSTSRLAYTNQVTEKAEGFFERLSLLVKDALETIEPYKWKIILIALGAGVGGLVLIWFLRKLIMALCYSGVGTLVLLIGVEVILLGMNVRLMSWFQGRRAGFSITYFSLVGIGVVFQLITMRSSKSKKSAEGKSVEDRD